MGWTGNLVGGSLKNGYVFVFTIYHPRHPSAYVGVFSQGGNMELKLDYSARDARDFEKFFHVKLSQYWEGIFGFDVTRFDDEVIKSGNQCLKDAVRQTYGQDAVALINRLLNVQS